MNIKSLSGLAQQVRTVEKPTEKQPLKLQDTTERDADGRRQQQYKKRKVTPEEVQKIIESLKANPGVVQNQLSVNLEKENEILVIYIKSPDGQIIRRITEDVFYQLVDSADLANGRIFNKAA